MIGRRYRSGAASFTALIGVAAKRRSKARLNRGGGEHVWRWVYGHAPHAVLSKPRQQTVRL